ncbi:MAG: RNA polymerase sigma factor (sigma-70 family) [Planctomycetota bacterium]|jgi:RNA polymerase sigma factor (sigma-70 family)
MSDYQISRESLARAVHGDSEELEKVLRALEPELRAGISIQPLWSRSLDADDVLQVSFMEAFLRITSFTGPSPAGFRAWMRRVVKNNLTDAIRSLECEKRPDARRRVTHGAGGESARTLFSAVVGDHPTAGARATAQESVEMLLTAVEQLPTSYKQVIREVDLAERTVADVAEEMGRSRGAVHLLRSRGHARLRELLRDLE